MPGSSVGLCQAAMDSQRWEEKRQMIQLEEKVQIFGVAA